MKWSEVEAIEAMRFCEGKTTARVDSIDSVTYETLTQYFTDGTAFRVEVVEGYRFSERTWGDTRVEFLVGKPE